MRGNASTVHREVFIAVATGAASGSLRSELSLPERPRGIVVFAHGSGSGSKSPRNRLVSAELVDQHLATLLLDLLTPEEQRLDELTGRLRFDVALLAGRLIGATRWLDHEEESTKGLPVGYFGASTGAAAALLAATVVPGVRAIVSRGGRPDLAGESLSLVRVPTLLIVGGKDTPIIALNHAALDTLHVRKRLEIIPGATHLFEEPGALAEVARLSGDWFTRFFEFAQPGDDAPL